MTATASAASSSDDVRWVQAVERASGCPSQGRAGTLPGHSQKSYDGFMIALWRTCQHYCERDSIPDIAADEVKELAAARYTVPRVGRFPYLVAESRGGAWETLGLMAPSSGKLTKQRNDLDRYDRGRVNGVPEGSWPGRVLVEKEHPNATRWVGRLAP